MLQKLHASGLTALDAQIDSIAAGLREIGARLEAIKATASIIHTDAARELQALKETLDTRSDLDRIVPLAEAAQRSSLSKDTLLRTHRDKIIRLSERRFGMKLRDVLSLGT